MVVRDMPASLSHYHDVLGFDVTFRWGDPVTYACLCRDEVSVHLSLERPNRPAGHGAACVFVTDVDALYQELAAQGANVVAAPQTWPYGMRDFDVTDPDGNRLTFGMAAGTVAQDGA